MQVQKREILAVVPARGSSKEIPRKNIYPLLGQPLIEYTFDAAKKSKLLTRVVLSTDDEEIAQIGRQNSIGVPFQRPKKLAADNTLGIAVVQHTVKYLEDSEGYRPDYVVILQPTSPLRRAEHIDGALRILLNTGADSVVSVVKVPHNFGPHSVMKLIDGRLKPFLEHKKQIFRRQDKPEVYARNGAAVYVVTYDTLVLKNSLFGDDCRPYLMAEEDSIDIDTLLDLEIAEFLLKRQTGAL